MGCVSQIEINQVFTLYYKSFQLGKIFSALFSTVRSRLVEIIFFSLQNLSDACTLEQVH